MSTIWVGAVLVLALSPLREAVPVFPSPVKGHSGQLSPIAATTLVEQRVVKVGTIRSNQVHVALENLTDQESLQYLSNSAPVGLVISVFVKSEQEDGSALKKGELAREICERVEKTSQSTGTKVEKWIAQLGTKSPGDVVGFNLGLTASERARFPIDRLIAVIFEQGHSSESTDFLHKSMVKVLADAKRGSLTALVVPCIGYRWDEKHSLEFEDLFIPLYEALDGSRRPLKVFVSLYDMWPSMVIEKATLAINRAGTNAVLATPRKPAR